jgi:hypothetical protein
MVAVGRSDLFAGMIMVNGYPRVLCEGQVYPFLHENLDRLPAVTALRPPLGGAASVPSESPASAHRGRDASPAGHGPRRCSDTNRILDPPPRAACHALTRCNPRTIETRNVASVRLHSPSSPIDLDQPLTVRISGKRTLNDRTPPDIATALDLARATWELQRPTAGRLDWTI